MEADVRGRFVWHELMTRDVPGAKNFYGKLVGWKLQPWPLDPSYTVGHSSAGPTAGIFAIPADLPADMPPHWVSYIGTRDVDGTAEAAVKAGGSILKAPDDIKGAGRYAVLRDPQGAAFAVLNPENARPDNAGPSPVGTFSWHELATTDNEAAFAFYSALFGWEAMMRLDMGPTGIYLIFGENGIQRGGMYIKPADYPAPPNWLPYVTIPDCDSSYKSAASLGAKGMLEPMEVPGGSRVAIFSDPTGAAIAIHAMPKSGPMAAPEPAKPAAVSAAPKKAKPKAQAKPKAKAKAKAKAKTKVKPKAKAKAKAKKKSVARKPAPKKKVSKKKSKTVRRKK